MCEENNRKTLSTLVEISGLLYVLQIALNSENQPTNDTILFAIW